MFPDVWYRHLLDDLPATVYVADLVPIGSTRYISRGVSRTLGFSPSDWVGDATLWSAQIHPADRARVVDTFRRARDARQLFRCRYRILTRAGQVRDILDCATPQSGGVHAQACYVGIRIDVTEDEPAG